MHQEREAVSVLGHVPRGYALLHAARAFGVFVLRVPRPQPAVAVSIRQAVLVPLVARAGRMFPGEVAVLVFRPGVSHQFLCVPLGFEALLRQALHHVAVRLVRLRPVEGVGQRADEVARDLLDVSLVQVELFERHVLFADAVVHGL